MDLDVLYRQVIMDNYKNPKNKGLSLAVLSEKLYFIYSYCFIKFIT